MAKKALSRKSGKPEIIHYNGEPVGYGCPELRVETIPVWLARALICRFHYSGRVVNNSYLHLGVYSGRDLVGVLQWGYALNPNSGARVVHGTGNRDYMELNRMWLHDCMPKNSESRAISYAIKVIRMLHPSVQWVQSFADERCGGAGIVYQACSFDFVGWHYSKFYELEGEWYHELCRTRTKKAGARGRYLQANFDRAVEHKFKQFRYVKFLNKRARKRLNTKLFNSQAYPKPGD